MVATLLVGAAIVFQVHEAGSLFHKRFFGFYGLIASIYLLTVPYLFLIRRQYKLELQAYIQIAVDLVMITVLVFLTGLEESVFSSVYILSIITGSIFFYRRGGLLAASLSSLLYGGLLDLRFYGLLPDFGYFDPGASQWSSGQMFNLILVNVIAYFVVALLSSYLAEQVRISRKALEETQSDLSDLTVIHENILECLHSGLLTVDLKGRITFANHSASELLELSKNDILSRPIADLFPNLPPEKLKRDIHHNLPIEARRQMMDYESRTGKKTCLGFSVTSLKNAEGMHIGAIIHFQDLTEIAAMEEHLRRVDRLAAIGELSARIAHEIRNPLASMSGSIQLLKTELSLDGQNRRLMEIVMREAQRLNRLLSDFLLFAKPAKLQFKDVDFSQILEETLDLFREQTIAGSSVRIRTEIAPDLTIRTDPEKIRQVAWNLLNNALEAMPEGGDLAVKAYGNSIFEESADRIKPQWIVLEIEDSGPGDRTRRSRSYLRSVFYNQRKGHGTGAFDGPSGPPGHRRKNSREKRTGNGQHVHHLDAVRAHSQQGAVEDESRRGGACSYRIDPRQPSNHQAGNQVIPMAKELKRKRTDKLETPAHRRTLELKCLSRISETLSSSLDLTYTLQEIFQILADFMGMTRGTLTLLNARSGELAIEIAHGLTPEEQKRGRYKLGEGITGRVVESGEPFAVPKIGDEPLFLNRTRSRRAVGRQDISFLCVPITVGRNVLGALSVDRLYTEEVSLQEDLRMMNIIATLVGQAVKLHQVIEMEKDRLIGENVKLQEELKERYRFRNIVGNSKKMQEVFRSITQVAESSATVMLRGESGTGKELVAQAIHYNSPRSGGPFVRVNCAALPESLIESELFGHERGAFTGAVAAKKGRFEQADKGTIFLDEVGDLSPTVQVKLLRVIQERTFERPWRPEHAAGGRAHHRLRRTRTWKMR